MLLNATIAALLAAGGSGLQPFENAAGFLKNARPMSGRSMMDRIGRLKSFSAAKGTPGVDSLATWSDSFQAPGFDPAGNPQSVWPYTMVGSAPESDRTTIVPAPIIPVTIELLDSDGHVALTHTGEPLRTQVTPEIVNAVLQSPTFQPFSYPFGRGQFVDVMQRTAFWSRVRHRGGFQGEDSDDGDGGWHTLLRPSAKPTRTQRIPLGSYLAFENLDGSCCLFVLIDSETFVNTLFPTTIPADRSTPIGAAEIDGDITTRDLTTFLFNNVYLYDGDPRFCCTLGFHSYDFEPGDPSNGNRERRYVMNFASWIDPGLFSFGSEDVTAHSHEVAEAINDPFVTNRTPWWLSVDPVVFGGQCQDWLETGDVIEVLTSNPVYAVAMNHRTYHPQNEAMFPWFAFQSPSRARNHSYSFPDETVLTTLSPPPFLAPPGPLLPGCVSQ